MAEYRKRGKTWEAYLNVGKDAEGNYIKKFKGGFKTKKEVEA